MNLAEFKRKINAENFIEEYAIDDDLLMKKIDEAMCDIGMIVDVPEWEEKAKTNLEPLRWVNKDVVIRKPDKVTADKKFDIPSDLEQMLKWQTLSKLDLRRASFFLAKANEVKQAHIMAFNEEVPHDVWF